MYNDVASKFKINIHEALDIVEDWIGDAIPNEDRGVFKSEATNDALINLVQEAEDADTNNVDMAIQMFYFKEIKYAWRKCLPLFEMVYDRSFWMAKNQWIYLKMNIPARRIWNAI